MIGTRAVDRWAVTFGTARRGLGGAAARPGPSSLYGTNVAAHPSTASVPITVLLYNGPLLCGFNVSIRGFIREESPDSEGHHVLMVHLLPATASRIFHSCGRFVTVGNGFPYRII